MADQLRVPYNFSQDFVQIARVALKASEGV